MALGPPFVFLPLRINLLIRLCDQLTD